MGKLRKPPTVFQGSHRQRSGEIVSDKQYSFRVQYQGKRKTIKTEFKNKKKAQEYVNSIYSSELKFSNFISKIFSDTLVPDTPQQPVVNENNVTTVIHSIISQGWLALESNPKRINHLKQEKNYGTNQARKIAYAFQHMFFDTNKYDWFANKPLRSISRTDAQNLSNELFKQRTYRGIECEGHPDFSHKIGNYRINIIALKGFFTFNHEELATIDINPFSKIKIPATTRTTQQKPIFTEIQLRMAFDKDMLRSFTFEDLKQKVKWDDFLNSVYFDAFNFTALTGMRSGEVRALMWKQISNDIMVTINQAFKENSIDASVIGKPKWDKSRKIILCDSAYEIIRSHDSNPDEFVFQNEYGKALNTKTWSDKFRYFISVLNKKMFFEDVPYTSHSFRGTLNTLLLKTRDVPESLIRKYLGWSTSSSLSVVQDVHYTNYSEEDTLTIAQAIEKIYSGKDMRFQYISSEERKNIITMFPNWEFFRDADLRLSKTNSLTYASLTKIFNHMVKKVNNHILFDIEVDEDQKDNLLQICKRSLNIEITKIKEIDTFYTQEMKSYLSVNKNTLPATMDYVTRLIFDFFIRKKELER